MLSKFWPSTYPTYYLQWRKNAFTGISRRNILIVDISSTYYLPHLVNLVKERPFRVCAQNNLMAKESGRISNGGE